MFRAFNIAKFLSLLVAILLLAGPRFAHAQQNTGSAPYRDSEHSYRVSIGDAANKRAWIITNGTTPFTIMDETEAIPPLPPAWASIIATGAGANQAGVGFHGVRIYFDHATFIANNWTLEYYEYEDHGGSYECISARSFPITLSDNTFWLAVSTIETDVYGNVADGIQVYNSQHNLVKAYTDLEAPNLFDTEIIYTVTMTKDANFDPTYWQFNANFADDVKSFSALVTSVDGGNAVTTTNTAGSDYTVVVTPALANVDEVTVTITVVYAHNVLIDVTRNLNVTNGVAVIVSPPAPDAITDDNITTYPTTNPGDRTQAVTILAIPSTRVIAFDNSTNALETEPSAQNPLQNSTHYYKVQMGAVANTGVWHLADSDDATVSTELTITPTKNTSDALATINFGALPTGTYTLYFTETNATTGAITIREYPIAIQPPFEVILAASGDQCATASGVVYQNLGITTTVVDYTISLPDTDPDPIDVSYYASAWSFTFGLVGDPVFAATNLEISSIATANPSGVSVAGTGASRTVNADAGVHSVTIRVTYSGYYSSEHDITVTISNVTGTYNEIASNKTDEHTIHAMPQAGELVGVD